MKKSIVFFLLTLLFVSGCKKTSEAELVIINGKVLSVDEDFSIKEAVAVSDGKIIFTGSGDKINSYIGKQTKVIDADGLTVLPGLIDAHAHLVSLGDKLSNLDITSCATFDELVEKVAERVAESEPGEWIVGGRWNHTVWAENKLPVHDKLSAVSPDNPVYLKRVDGNSAFVNAKALELAGITSESPDPSGGYIHKDNDGEPTGVLINQAMNIVKDLIGKDTDEQLQAKLELATAECAKYGLTGVHEAGVGPGEIAVFKKMADASTLKLRVNAMLGEQEKPTFQVDNLSKFFKENRLESYASDMLCVKTIKLFFDGALGSRGAAFFKPYNDDPGNIGLLRTSVEYITEVGLAALENNMSVATHCIGIRANSLCLDAYEKALKEYPEKDHRFRIEHAQIVRKEDIDRFAALKIIPSMQPTHCTSDKNMIADRIGEERTEYAYAWRSFLDAGLVIPAGSDFPVETVNPLLGIYAAVSRKLPKDPDSAAWHTEQRMTIEEAIRGFTIWAAYASFQEDIIGSIEVGKYADFTILDQDISTIDPEKIVDTKVIYTIVAGEIKYSAEIN